VTVPDAVDVLADYPLTFGGEYNRQTGAFVSNTVCGYTEKFTLEDGRYVVGGSISDRAIYVWDENDNYICKLAMCSRFIAKAGYKYAMSVYPVTAETDMSGMTLKRERVANATTTSIDLTALAWSTTANFAEADVSNYGIELATIKNANGIVKLTGNSGGDWSTKLIPIFGVYGSNTVAKLQVFNMTAEAAMAYFAEKFPTLTFSE
jgi:hypothetical protein